jgi:hypothetical protein
MRAVLLRVLAPLLLIALTAVTVAACASPMRPAPPASSPDTPPYRWSRPGTPAGRLIGSPRPLIMHNPGPVKTAALAPGQRALAWWLGVAETVLFTGASCNPVHAHWLRVYPPDLLHAVYLPIKPSPAHRPWTRSWKSARSTPIPEPPPAFETERIAAPERTDQPRLNNAHPQRQMRMPTWTA